MAKFNHELFMIAAEDNNLVVTVVCKPDKTVSPEVPSLSKCVYEVSIPRDTAAEMTVEEMFQEAQNTFHSIQKDL